LDPDTTEHVEGRNNQKDGPQQEVLAYETHTQALMRQISEQQAIIARLKAECLAFQAQRAESPASISQPYRPPTPDLSINADSDVGNASSTTNMSIKEPAEQSEAIAPFVEEGSLAQMGLYHRVQQQRVDQEYDDVQIAELERHDHSDNIRNNKKGPSNEAIMSMFEMLAKEVKEIKAAQQNK
jgi:hypothetical protein